MNWPTGFLTLPSVVRIPSFSGLRVYYIARGGTRLTTAMRSIALDKLHATNHKTLTDQNEGRLGCVGTQLPSIGGWFGDGCSVNGVQPSPQLCGEGVCAELQRRGSRP